MLLHRVVHYSTFAAQLNLRSCLDSCNRWLQCGHMRIELPTASWADTVHRADEDAHTLTVAAQPALDLFAGAWSADCGLVQRAAVSTAEPVTLTLTL
jgi:hypothetical protein